MRRAVTAVASGPLDLTLKTAFPKGCRGVLTLRR